MAIILRRIQSWRLGQLSRTYHFYPHINDIFRANRFPRAQVLNRGSTLEQALRLSEDEGCSITDSHFQDSPCLSCLSCYTSNQTTPECNSALPSRMLQFAPSNTSMTQQTHKPNEEFYNTIVETWSHDLDHSAFKPQIHLKPVYAQEPLSRSQGCFYPASNGEQKTCEEFEVSLYQNVKHLNHKESFKSPRPSGASLGSITKPPVFRCEEPRCTKSFTRRHNLKRHMQTHLKRNPYICGKPECHCAFDRYDSFRAYSKHANIHRGYCGCYVFPLVKTSADCDPHFHCPPLPNERWPHTAGDSQYRPSSLRSSSADNLFHGYTYLDGAPSKNDSYPSPNTIFPHAVSPPPSLVYQQGEPTHLAQQQATSHSLTWYHQDLSPRIPVAGHNSNRNACSTCHKTFSHPYKLRLHYRSHTDIKPFQCSNDGCGKRFSVQSNARRHERQYCTRVGSKKQVMLWE